MPRLVFGFAALLALAGSADGGKFNKVLSVGDPGPAWEKLAGTDGKMHALADLKGKDVVVVVFTCNSCPVAEAYEDRLVAFAKTHAGPDGKVGLVAVNVNTGKDDALPAMKARAEKKGFPFPYLFDPTQEIARRYGAQFTPEFVVLDKGRKVVYLGAMDNKAPPGQPTITFVEDAVTAALAGKPPVIGESSAAAGCGIKFNKKKRDED